MQRAQSLNPLTACASAMAPQQAATADRLEDVLAHLESTQEAHLAELQELVRIPSVSADAAYEKDVKRAADWLAARLEKAGLENVGLIETSGHPAVVADWMHAGDDKPTLLVYGHYDVQPATKEDGWVREPFEPVVEDDRIWGRGTTDDKGQLLCHVYAAEGWLQKTGALPVNLRMVFEGEEEVGSAHYGEVIEKAKDRLAADVLVVSDSPMRGEDQPAITHSLRGLVYLLVDVKGPRGDLHSGTWGGVVWNPLEALVHMLGTLKDRDTGTVTVPGFYDEVVEPTVEERERLKEVAESDASFLEGTGSSALHGEEGWTPSEQVGLRPTLEFNGIRGGYIGEGAKTVIPASAHAKVSCRLVADQDPAKVATLITEHLQKVAPEGVTVDVTLHSSGDAVRADPDHPYVGAIEKALEETWGNRPVLIPEGGSIPAVADMQNLLGALPVLAGFGHKDENMHAPDESFRLKNFYRGREASARMMLRLAETKA